VVRKHPLLLSYLMQIIKGIRVERRTHTERSLTLIDDTWAQIDGEALKIPAMTDVLVRSSKLSFRLLSTKLTPAKTKTTAKP
jgi:hypothetical protein